MASDMSCEKGPIESSDNHQSTSVTIIVQSPPPKKSICDAYVLAVPLGFTGAHHFYLRRYGWGFLYLFTFGLLGVGWIVDWFRVPQLVKETNYKLAHPNLPEKKKLHDCYVLWFPFGLLGFHHFYLHRLCWGFVYLFTFGLFGLGWLIDMFRMKHLVDDYNKKLEGRLETGPITKDICEAYTLTLIPFTGLLGMQHYYLDRVGFGVAYTCTLGLFGIGWLFDCVRMSCLVKSINKDILSGKKDGRKRLDDAYIMLFPLGLIGLHHYYLRRWGWGVLYTFTLGCFGIGWLIDFFRLPCLVADYNKKLAEDELVTNVITSGGTYSSSVNDTSVSSQSISPGTYAATGTTYQPQTGLCAPPSAPPQGGVYPVLAGYPPQAPPQYQASAFPSVHEESSWSTIASSEVGHEQPPSYQEAVQPDEINKAVDNGGPPPRAPSDPSHGKN